MKRLLSLTAAIAFSALAIGPAMAQMTVVPSGGQTPVNCAALSGSPYMCVRNNSHYSVTDILTVLPSAWGTFNPNTAAWNHIPGGSVPPGGVTIVKFNTNFFGPGCVQNIVVKTASGFKMTPNFNVCNAPSFTIPDWQ